MKLASCGFLPKECHCVLQYEFKVGRRCTFLFCVVFFGVIFVCVEFGGGVLFGFFFLQGTSFLSFKKLGSLGLQVNSGG